LIGLRNIIAGIDKNSDGDTKILTNSNRVTSSLSNLDKLAKSLMQNQIPADIELLSRNLANKMAKQAALAIEEAKQSKDSSSKKKLNDAASELEGLIPNITNVTKKIFSMPPQGRDLAPVRVSNLLFTIFSSSTCWINLEMLTR
jgi:hypothetical protein